MDPELQQELSKLEDKFTDLDYFDRHPGIVKDSRKEKENIGCLMATTGKINNNHYDVEIVLSKTEIRKLSENFLEQGDLVEILKKKCGDVPLKELMK